MPWLSFQKRVIKQRQCELPGWDHSVPKVDDKLVEKNVDYLVPSLTDFKEQESYCQMEEE